MDIPLFPDAAVLALAIVVNVGAVAFGMYLIIRLMTRS